VTSAGRNENRGHLYTPGDFDAKKKYPLLVVITEGDRVDQPVVNADRYIRSNVCARGAGAAAEYRGSAGYGEKFAR